MMKWKVYFVEGWSHGTVEATSVGADNAGEAMNEAATKLGIVDLDRFYVHAIPTGDPWEED